MKHGRDDNGREKGQLVVGTAVKQLKHNKRRAKIISICGETNTRQRTALRSW